MKTDQVKKQWKLAPSTHQQCTAERAYKLGKETVISTCLPVLFQLIARNDSQLTYVLCQLIALSPVEIIKSAFVVVVVC